ncbi:MAG: nucleoside deaminase [Anaerolineales bacterium]|nr:nucleoside deaminase [Anaerolineales bacterium]
MAERSRPFFNSQNTSLSLDLPDWAVADLNLLPTHIQDIEGRMQVVIEFSRKNFRAGTGGPFAAGIFERQSGRLVVIGVNRVVPFNCSPAHAEIMGISLAQRILNHYDLGAPDMPEHQIVVNWRPCAMCFGAVFWSGITSMAIAGAGPELEEITGFDEGPIHPGWRAELDRRGIHLQENILRDQAIEVYQEFAGSNQFVYNARLGANK